jgi:hypothetical protein
MKKCFDQRRRWGTARKALNLFLRDVLYNRYLYEEHRFFQELEPLLELPLDSDAAQGLRQEPEGQQLEKWPKLKCLTVIISDEYQDVAQHVAVRLGFARVHLDLRYWRPE